MIEPEKHTENAEGSGKMPSPFIRRPSDGKGKLFCALCALLRPITDFVPLLGILLFVGTLFWAKEQDPYTRQWFTLKTADGNFFKCITILPKLGRQHPVIIYAHGSGDNMMTGDNNLRQMAEFGLSVISIENNQSNEAAFTAEFESLLSYIRKQKWADASAIAWLGSSTGANRMLDFALSHPKEQPKLLVLASGDGTMISTNLNCPVLLVHGEKDEVFPAADAIQFANELRSNGVAVEMKLLPGLPHNLQPDRSVVFRCIGEYCVTRLSGEDAWQRYHSIARWQAEAPSLVWFWLPAAAWAVGWFVWKRKHRLDSAEKPKLQRSEIVLRWLAAILATWALAETGFHLLPPYFQVTDKMLTIARRMLVQDNKRADFEALAARPIWQGQKLQTLLEHVELAGYNRELINWQLDDTMYRDQVLSPIITSEAGERLDWRRPLWEEFYPCIRHESSPEDAARIVVRHLRERVTVVEMPKLCHAVPDIWLRQLTDKTGFQIIYVAALRSIGVPARLDANRQAELFNGEKWEAAPRPVIFEAIGDE